MHGVPPVRRHSWRRHWHHGLLRQLRDALRCNYDVYVTAGAAALSGTAGAHVASRQINTPTTPDED